MLPNIGQFPVSGASIRPNPVSRVSGWVNSRLGEYSPATGSRRSRWAKTSWRMSAIQKIGIDTPRMAPALIAWSLARPGQRAEISPSGTATTSAMIMAAMTSSSEAGAATARSDSTGRWVWIEMPQFPVRMPPK